MRDTFSWSWMPMLSHINCLLWMHGQGNILVKDWSIRMCPKDYALKWLLNNTVPLKTVTVLSKYHAVREDYLQC
jgi:hypothetical protein